MAGTLKPADDLVLVYDASASEYGKAALYDVVKSVVSTDVTGRLNLSYSPTSGKISFGFDAAGLVTSGIQIIPGAGLSGGGDLSSDITLSLDLSSVTAATNIDTSADTVPFYDASAGVTRVATIDDLTAGVTGSIPIGSIA